MIDRLRHVRHAMFSAYLMNLWRTRDGRELDHDMSCTDFFRFAGLGRVKHYPCTGLAVMEARLAASVARQFERMPTPTDPVADVSMAAAIYFEAFPPVATDIDFDVLRNAITRLAFLTRLHARKICEIFASIARAKPPYASSAVVATRTSELVFPEMTPEQIHPFVSDCLLAAGVGPVTRDFRAINAPETWRDLRSAVRVDMIYYDAFFGRGPGAPPAFVNTVQMMLWDLTQGRLIALPGILPMGTAKRLAESGVQWVGKIRVPGAPRYGPRPSVAAAPVEERPVSPPLSVHLCMCEGDEIARCSLCSVSNKRPRYTGGESSSDSHSGSF